MPEGREGREGDLAAARELVGAGLAALEASRERIDNLNVYPVPDGDTGTNMVLTLRAVADALAVSGARTRGDLAREATRACLLGARGNSGVILSQLVRGAADVLAEREEVDATVVGAALRRASDAAYAAIREPQEGTILTVARALAERAEQLEPSVSLAEALGTIVGTGEESLARTPEQLPLLREAGVVDAGGAGLVELVRGIAAHVSGEPLPEVRAAPEQLPLEAVHRELSRYRYCTSFYVEGAGAEPARLERELAELGDSLLVVGSPGAVKVHLHTDEPGRALSFATAVGELEEIDIENMHVQTTERTERLVAVSESAACAVVAVAPGAGNGRLFRSLGAAQIVDGGLRKPSASELAAAIDSAGASDVLVLPNDPDVVMAAEQAAAAAEKRARIVRTSSLQAGLGAMVAFDGARGPDENVAEMEAAARLVRAGGVTRASRSAASAAVAVEEGDYLGMADGEPVASGPILEVVAREVVQRLVADGADVLTILLGEGVAEVDSLRREVEAAHPELEVEVHEGGQPHYQLLFSVE